MRKRCLCSTAHNYLRYGGRGINICPRWDDYSCFLADMGERPDGTSLDRIDNDGDYCPENCRWVDTALQVRNRSTTVFVEAFGHRLTLQEWADKTGLSYNTLMLRKKRGLPDREVVSNAYNLKPARGQRKQRKDASLVHLDDGRSLLVVEWAEELGISYMAAYKRAKKIAGQ